MVEPEQTTPAKVTAKTPVIVMGSSAGGSGASGGNSGSSQGVSARGGNARVAPASLIVSSEPFVLTDEMKALYPMPMVEGFIYEAPSLPVEAEGVMPTDVVNKAWVALFSKWGITDRDTQGKMVIAVLKYFIKNGTSSQNNYSRVIKCDGGTYRAKVLDDVLNAEVRRFCRAQADMAVMILRADPKLRDEMGVRMGLVGADRNYAFDFSDAANGIKKDTYDAIRAARLSVLNTSTKPFSDGRANQNAVPLHGNGFNPLPPAASVPAPPGFR